MRKVITTLLIFAALILSSVSAFAADAKAAYEKGAMLYGKGEYRAAVEEYTKAAAAEKSTEIYYNLGNCYYRLSEYPEARLAWERALRLDPSYSDARYNLKIVVAKIKFSGAQPQSFISSWARDFVYSRNIADWTLYALISFALMLTCFLVYYFGGRLSLRKGAFAVCIIALIALVTTLTCSIVQTVNGDAPTDAIVLRAGDIRQSPSPHAKALQHILPGAKIRLTRDNSVKGWRQISLDGDQKGWIDASTIGLI